MSESARADNVIPFGPRSGGAARRAPGDAAGGLADRVGTLEAQLGSLQANLERERRLLTLISESDAAVDAAASGTAPHQLDEGADVEQRARALLERAIAERRALSDQVAQLRAERDTLLDQIASLRRSNQTAAAPAAPASQPALDTVVGALHTVARESEAEGRPTAQSAVTETVVKAPIAPTAGAAPAIPSDVPPSTDRIASAWDALYEDVEELPPTRRALPIVEAPAATLAPPTEPIVDIDVLAPSPSPVPDLTPERPQNAGILDDDDVHAIATSSDEMTSTESDAPAAAPIVAAIGEAAAMSEATPPAVDHAPDAAPLPDAAVADLWEDTARTASDVAVRSETAALIATTAEVPAPSRKAVERASFITDEFILGTSPLLRPRVAEPAPESEVAPPIEKASPAVAVGATPRQAPATIADAPAVAPQRAANRIQLVISPVASFTRLLEIQRRLEAVSSIRELQLRDYRNGVAIFALAVAEAISAHEFGAVVQMLGFGLRLLGANQMNVELRVEDETPAS